MWQTAGVVGSIDNPFPTEGVTDEGLRYRMIRTPNEAPPVVLEVWPPRFRNFSERSPQTMVGQAFGLRWGDKVLMLRVLGGRYNPVLGTLELHCS